MRALRALADKPGYVRLARESLATAANLTIDEGMVEDLILEAGRAIGVVTAAGERLFGQASCSRPGRF